MLPQSLGNTTVIKSLPVSKTKTGSKGSLESEAPEAVSDSKPPGEGVAVLQPPTSFSSDEVFHVPVLVNHKHINSGDELLVYEKPVTKQKGKLDPIKTEVLLQKLRKRPREN